VDKLMNGFQNTNMRLYALLAACLVLFGAWQIGDTVSRRLAAVPVKEAPAVVLPREPLNTRSFYPVWIKQAVALTAQAQEQGVDVDTLFRKQEEKVAVEKPVVVEPNYGRIVVASVTVDATSDNGAVINGQFVANGQKIPGLAITKMDGKRIEPVLKGVAGEMVAIKVGDKVVTALARRTEQ